MRGAATSSPVTVQMPAGVALESSGYKMLAIYGRTAEGVGMQSNHMSCSARPAGAECEGN